MINDSENIRRLIEMIEAGIGPSGNKGIASNPEPFWKKFMEASQELADNLQDLGICHVDSNIRLILAMSLLAAAYSGCVPRAKWFRPIDEADGIGRLSNDDDRVAADTLHKEWEKVLVDFFRLGRETARAFRKGRGQPVYGRWLE